MFSTSPATLSRTVVGWASGAAGERVVAVAAVKRHRCVAGRADPVVVGRADDLAHALDVVVLAGRAVVRLSIERDRHGPLGVAVADGVGAVVDGDADRAAG